MAIFICHMYSFISNLGILYPRNMLTVDSADHIINRQVCFPSWQESLGDSGEVKLFPLVMPLITMGFVKCM